jgi:DNA-binding IclR family transcriptional regulator
VRELTDVITTLGLTERAADWISAGDLARQTSTSPALLRELLNDLVSRGVFLRDNGRYRAAGAS